MAPKYPGPIPQWLDNNKAYAKEVFPTLPPPFQMAERSKIAIPDASIILTCLDPRCIPENFFGPNFRGPVFRNAGGRATDDAIRSFALLRALADMKSVTVIHHTDCGMMHVTTQEIVNKAGESGEAAKVAAEKIDWGLFTADEVEQSIKEDVRVLKQAPALKGMNVYGFKLDTFTGEVEPVAE